MRKISFGLLLLLIASVIFAENVLEGKEFLYSEVSHGTYISFSSDSITITEYDNITDTKTVSVKPYKIVDDSGLLYILSGEQYETKWLCLYSEGLILLYEDDGPWFFRGEIMTLISSHIDLIGFYRGIFTTSSYLSENLQSGKIEYKCDNLSNPEIPNPWVEGVEGYGIGEKIFSTLIKDSYSSDKILVFSNGYVSYHRPDLYQKNSRVKTIRIHDIESGKSLDYTIPDSPNMFEISLYEIIGSEGFEIEIIDVYKGTHYDDTCINFIGLIDLYGY